MFMFFFFSFFPLPPISSFPSLPETFSTKKLGEDRSGILAKLYFTLEGEGRTRVAQRGRQSPSSMEASARETYQRPESVSREAEQGQQPGIRCSSTKEVGKASDRMHILLNIQICVWIYMLSVICKQHRS